MKHCLEHLSVLIFLIALLTAGITGALVDDPAVAEPESRSAEPAESTRSTRTSLTTMSDAQAENLSPLHREMRQVLLRERGEVETLAVRLAALDDRLAALELQREISDRRFQTQIELLEVQGRHARLGGRIQQAEEAETAVVRLKARLETRQADRRQR